MDIMEIRAEYEAKKGQISKEIESFVDKAINYDELIEAYEQKYLIDYAAHEFNNTEETRYFDNLQSTAWMIRQVLVLSSVYEGMNDDERKSYRAKKALETLMTLIGNVKKVSNVVIEREQKVINEADLALNLLGQFRKEMEERKVTK